MKSLEEFNLASWETPLSAADMRLAVTSLEGGKVLYFPALAFLLSDVELQFLNPEKVDPKRKNISYDLHKDHLGGSLWEAPQDQLLKSMIQRFALSSRKLLERLIPGYKNHLIQARTSFRPVEIYGRKHSVRKDDSLLHVDAFPSAPTKGQRILRVFSNINSEGKQRVWRTGESFETVVEKFAGSTPKPFPGIPQLLKLLKITKDIRTPYDYSMLHMHNKMKEDSRYQRDVAFEEVCFPPGSSWIVYTDQVSHAAISGQHVLEQTFHLPVTALKGESTAPLRVLEKHFGCALI